MRVTARRSTWSSAPSRRRSAATKLIRPHATGAHPVRTGDRDQPPLEAKGEAGAGRGLAVARKAKGRTEMVVRGVHRGDRQVPAVGSLMLGRLHPLQQVFRIGLGLEEGVG